MSRATKVASLALRVCRAWLTIYALARLVGVCFGVPGVLAEAATQQLVAHITTFRAAA